jgi:hypothetical protein
MEYDKFTFSQFLKIIGKVNVVLGENTTHRSDIDLLSKRAVNNLDYKDCNEESKNHIELQQSLNYDDKEKPNIKFDRNKDLGRNEAPISFERRTPRLLNNIVAKKNAKSSSVEKSSSK